MISSITCRTVEGDNHVYCGLCHDALRLATKTVCFSGKGPKTGKWFDHVVMYLCEDHFLQGMRDPPDEGEVIHEIRSINQESPAYQKFLTQYSKDVNHA